jgi:hypothetical protein
VQSRELVHKQRAAWAALSFRTGSTCESSVHWVATATCRAMQWENAAVGSIVVFMLGLVVYETLPVRTPSGLVWIPAEAMDGLKILCSTRLLVQTNLPTRDQPSCRRLQHRNSDTKRPRLTQPPTLDDQLRVRHGAKDSLVLLSIFSPFIHPGIRTKP